VQSLASEIRVRWLRSRSSRRSLSTIRTSKKLPRAIMFVSVFTSASSADCSTCRTHCPPTHTHTQCHSATHTNNRRAFLHFQTILCLCWHTNGCVMCAVVEAHQGWSGPCECVKPMLYRISLDKEEIKFCTAASEKVRDALSFCFSCLRSHHRCLFLAHASLVCFFWISPLHLIFDSFFVVDRCRLLKSRINRFALNVLSHFFPLSFAHFFPMPALFPSHRLPL
jgi:hypothetical protein